MIEASLDVSTVDAARNGDRAAFGRLHEEYARVVHGVLLAHVPRSEAQDLVQDVFLLALKRLKTLRDARRFGAWILCIARNRAKDWHRRGRRPLPLDAEPAAAAPAAAHDGGSEDATRAMAAIMALRETYRETLILRLVEGLSGPEIARRTGLTPGSVRVNLHRGMKQLRDRLDRERQR